MKSSLVLTVVTVLFFQFFWLAPLLAGVWGLWYSWQMISNPDFARTEVDIWLRSQEIAQVQTNHWNKPRFVDALCYTTIGPVGVVMGMWLFLQQLN
ncbi:hypothetical protein H6F88_26100 [Oculatella sp. FACHB-28]|uniref:hypothetical protein n=1 Tax=Oculatella sp. FACHB-28 TaxID=2692845 RepID=UPI001688DAAA|nr:hypothetical protein [Oculatella sp. FACHB-28]MBD2059428.1 hypothetical protein [Oculatella sp. FACHB-28]